MKTMPRKKIKRKLFDDSDIQTNSELMSSSKKKRKYNPDNQAYNPRHQNIKLSEEEKENRRQRVVQMGTDNATTFVNDKGEEEKIYTFMVCYLNDLELNCDPEKLDDALQEVLKKIDSHVPCAEILEFNVNGSPIKLRLENNVVVTRRESQGPINFFDNRPPIPVAPLVTEINSDHDFFKSDAYLHIRKHLAVKKSQTQEINADVLSAVRKQKQRRATGPGRKCTQNKVVVEKGIKESEGSATRYATETKLFPNMQWNWLHLIAEIASGDDGMVIENLLLNTKFDNTRMQLWEAILNKLSPEGFTLIVEAKTIKIAGVENESLHIGTELSYHIKTKNFIIPLNIQLQSNDQPLHAHAQYTRALVTALIDAHKQSTNKQNLKQVEQEFNELSNQKSNVSDTDTSPKKKLNRAKKNNFSLFVKNQETHTAIDQSVNNIAAEVEKTVPHQTGLFTKRC